jgi:signal transduction histidine kinase/ActR/RegA family two-component response regulator/HAMP domain-containing protein
MLFRGMPLRKTLMAMMLLTSGSVLVLTCLGFSAYEYFNFRRGIVQHLTTISDMIARNSTAALAFKDREGAEEILSALKAEPNIVAAALYDLDGTLFCQFPLDLTSASLPTMNRTDGFFFESNHLKGWRPVVQGNKRLGSLYVVSGLQAGTARFQLYGFVAGVMALLACLLAYFLSKLLQRQISTPILSLVETASRVSAQGDYSVRASKLGTEELALLSDSFNHMLNRIQNQMSRLELLNRVTRAIAERMDLKSIYQVIAGTLEDDLPLDFICVSLYDPSANNLSILAIGAKSIESASAMGINEESGISIDSNGLSRCIRGVLVYEPDISQVAFPFPKLMAEQGFRSLVLAPLLVESGVFGVLIAARTQAQGFSSMDCEFLRQLCEHAGLASNQANLYSELQRAHENLKQSQEKILQQERLRALGQMASGIAHDINNAISPVSLYAEYLLEREPGLSPRAREHLETMSCAIEDVAATVGRLREFYREHEPQDDFTPVQLNRALQQVVDLTRARWHDIPQQRGIVFNIKTEYQDDLPLVMGVEAEIREALTNLFFNGFDAMPEGGTLTLRTRKVGQGHVSIEVIDTGSGMDEETRKRCLEPFYTTKGERGTGLGLAMVYGVMQRHGAAVAIESTQGVGTTMRLTFSIADPAAAFPVSVESKLPPIMKILVTDDDPMILKSLGDALCEDGHTVERALGGKLGIELYLAACKRGEPFQAVITDLGMPYVDGSKVAVAIHEADISAPVILLTGWGQRLVAEGEIPPHVFRVLAKPPKLKELRKALLDCTTEWVSS